MATCLKMDYVDVQSNTVDPAVRAHVSSLVSALGGTGASEDGRYVLGDEGLACLKDLKKWLRLYDEKANRLDVARCLAEANLVKGDLLEILAAWPEAATTDRLRSKTALACVELLVPLTWPVDKIDAEITINHHRHIPYLQLAQLAYKQAILQHESGSILRTAVRTGISSIALPAREREPRDDGIIKLLLFFFRNVAMISSPHGLPTDIQESEISRSATIDAFHAQDVLALILTMASNVTDEFSTQDTVLLDVLFHLIKGVDAEKLFLDEKRLHDRNDQELKSLLSLEANMHRDYAKTAPTRHNRFGTMIWVARDGAGRHSTVSGQDILKDGQKTLSKMDQTKKWNKPRQRVKNDDPAPDRFDLPVTLTTSARTHLRSFVEEFLDSGFNPLFNHIRRSIEREADRVLDSHKQEYFYLVAWFLQAERVRRTAQAERHREDPKFAESFEPDSFGLVSSVLIQEFFLLMHRYLQNALDLKLWREVQAGMCCFTQILLVVQDMAESPLEEDKEIADNIQNRIFYEETTHDRVIAIIRGYKDQGFGYLNATTELSHVFLRMLERYSRDNVDLQIRSKRRARKKAQARQQKLDSSANMESTDMNAANTEINAIQDEVDSEAEEDEEIEDAMTVTRERKFDFARLSAKFTTQACVDTFVSLTRYYNDLSPEQLKRAHRFFYRVGFKQEQSILLFRIDIIGLFQKLIKGPDGLDCKASHFREWDDLIRQIFKKLVRKLQDRPELAVELLFSKVPSTAFYLEHGYEKESNKSKPRPPAPLAVRGDLPVDEQIGVVVAVLSAEHSSQVQWIMQTLSPASDQRKSWENEIAARAVADAEQQDATENLATDILASPPDEITRIAMFKNARLRLLLELSGLTRQGDADDMNAKWFIPSHLTSSTLQQTHDMIRAHLESPTMTYGEDSIAAEDMLRRKPTEAIHRAVYDDDSDDDGIVSDGDAEGFLFPAGGPTNTVARPRESALEALKRKRRRRRNNDLEGDEDEEQRQARREARAKADLERRRGIKSAQFVHDSDDESDNEKDQAFFASEAARRQGQHDYIAKALQRESGEGMSSDEEREPVSKRPKQKKKRAKSSTSGPSKHSTALDDDSSSGESVMTSDTHRTDEETPLSSPTNPLAELIDSTPASAQSLLQKDIAMIEDDDDELAAELVPSMPPNRRRARAAVFDDSDDE